MPTDATETAAEARPGAKWVRLAFLTFVALQIAVPASYYLRDDRYDERFAWRMFSGIRMTDCTTRAWETRDGQRELLPLSRTVHTAWIEHLSRNRRRVIDAFLFARCATGASEVVIENLCSEVVAAPPTRLDYVRDCVTSTTRYPSPMQPGAHR